MAGLGEADYRAGGLERLRDAGRLLRQESFAGGVYLAGRAVEAMLRALIWTNDSEVRAGRKSLETGHDLREMLALVAQLGVLRREEHRSKLAEDVQVVARLWFNNMRFVSTRRLETRWRDLGVIGRRRTLKAAATDYYDACSAIVKRCEVLCQS